MHKLLPFLRRIERTVYPPHIRQMQGVRTVRDLAEYCECRPGQIFILTGQNWYILAAERADEVEIVDFASAGACREVFRMLATVIPRWRGKRIVMDTRETTSYPFVLLLARRYRLRVLQDDTWHWGNEVMHDLVLGW